MEFPEIVEIVQVKSKQALDSHLAGNHTAAIEALQEVATLISSEFGATDEVAAASPEGEEPSDEEKAAELYAVIAQAQKCLTEAESAVTACTIPVAREHLLRVAELVADALATESG